jgi:hypothetical protein
VVLGILSLSIAVLGWYLSTCIAERREAFQEFKRTSTAYHLAFEKEIQAHMSFDSAQKHLADYLDQDNVQTETVKSLYTDLESSARNMQETCNLLNEAAYSEQNALPAFLEYYHIDLESSDIVFNCEKPTQLALKVNTIGVTDQPERLARDKALRKETVRKERINIEKNTKFTANHRLLGQYMEEQRTIAIVNIELHLSSSTSGAWDCLRSLVTKKREN